MTQRGIDDFVTEAASNADLHTELCDQLRGAAAEDLRKLAAAIGTKYGYAFTVDDVAQLQAVIRDVREQQSGDELSDEQLESVAGGRGISYGAFDYRKVMQRYKIQYKHKSIAERIAESPEPPESVDSEPASDAVRLPPISNTSMTDAAEMREAVNRSLDASSPDNSQDESEIIAEERMRNVLQALDSSPTNIGRA